MTTPTTPPPYWSDDARAALALFTLALDLLEKAGTYEGAVRLLNCAKHARAQASARAAWPAAEGPAAEAPPDRADRPPPQAD